MRCLVLIILPSAFGKAARMPFTTEVYRHSAKCAMLIQSSIKAEKPSLSSNVHHCWKFQKLHASRKWVAFCSVQEYQTPYLVCSILWYGDQISRDVSQKIYYRTLKKKNLPSVPLLLNPWICLISIVKKQNSAELVWRSNCLQRHWLGLQGSQGLNGGGAAAMLAHGASGRLVWMFAQSHFTGCLFSPRASDPRGNKTEAIVFL